MGKKRTEEETQKEEDEPGRPDLHTTHNTEHTSPAMVALGRTSSPASICYTRRPRVVVSLHRSLHRSLQYRRAVAPRCTFLLATCAREAAARKSSECSLSGRARGSAQRVLALAPCSFSRLQTEVTNDYARHCVNRECLYHVLLIAVGTESNYRALFIRALRCCGGGSGGGGEWRSDDNRAGGCPSYLIG